MLWMLESICILSLTIGVVHGCVDDYLTFTKLAFSNNSENRLNLYQAFYPPNTHLPYSVLVTYRTLLNETHVNISTDQNCPNRQVWIWLSSPVFLFQEPFSLNRHTLFTLNFFEDWIPPHITITVPYPCQDQAEGFLQRMTTSLQSYADVENAGRFKGNVARACGENTFVFISVELSVVAGFGFILLGLFILLAIPVTFQRIRYLRDLANNEEDYSFNSFGIFWGVSTTLFICAITIICLDLWFLVIVFHNLGIAMQVVWVLCIIILVLFTTAAALFIAIRSIFTDPHLYLLLARICCCRYGGHARKLFACLALWFDMLALQLLCHHAVVAFLAIPAAPLIIVTNVLFIVLLCTCAINTFAVVFTLCARVTNECYTNVYVTDEVPLQDEAGNKFEDDDWRYLLRTLILIPLLMAVGLFTVLLAFSGKYVNSATEQDSFLSFLLSIIIPLLLTGTVIGLQFFIKTWLQTDKQRERKKERKKERKDKELPAVEVQLGASECMNITSTSYEATTDL